MTQDEIDKDIYDRFQAGETYVSLGKAYSVRPDTARWWALRHANKHFLPHCRGDKQRIGLTRAEIAEANDRFAKGLRRASPLPGQSALDRRQAEKKPVTLAEEFALPKNIIDAHEPSAGARL